MIIERTSSLKTGLNHWLTDLLYSKPGEVKLMEANKTNDLGMDHY